MGEAGAADVADLLTTIGKRVIQIIVLADDGGRERMIDYLG